MGLKVQLLSDTHTQDYTVSPDADLIVHLGDAGNGKIKYIQEFVDKCKAIDKPYVFVAGNHDAYNWDITALYEWMDSQGINYLTDGKEFVYRGYTMVGGTLFTNFQLYSNLGYDVDKYKIEAQANISDFHCVKLNGKLVTPDDYVTMFNKQYNWINKYRGRDDVIVMTHFLPNKHCVDPYWLGHPHCWKLNTYFASNIDVKGFKNWWFGHCVDMQTEILTERGWKFRGDLEESDSVYTYNPDSSLLELSPIQKITDVSYTGDVYHFKGASVNQRVTDKHRMVGYTPNGKYTVLSADALSKRKSPFKFVKSGQYVNSGIELSDDLLELYIAIAADGAKPLSSGLVRFGLDKLRKKKYVISLLDRLSLSYKMYGQSCELEGRSSINFYLPSQLADWNIKGLDERLLNCNKQQFEIILKAYSNTDGRRLGSIYSVYTSKISEYNILTHLATLNCYSSTTAIRDKKGFSKGLSYSIDFTERSRSMIEKPNLYHTKEAVIDEPFWCITVNNSNFISRRVGKISLTGNTHSPVDKVADGCHLLCNPKGYLNELAGSGFKENLIIELPQL